ncbi:MAG: penicillin-binding protein activator [Pseudomonadota bacterium]
MRFITSFLCCLAVLAGCSSGEPIKLGYLGGLSGRVADLGEAGRNGVQLAVDQVNAAGGVGGRQVDLIIQDDGQDSQKAQAAIDAFVAAGVRTVIGPMTSTMAIAILDRSKEAGLLLISPTVTASTLSGRDDNLFKVVSSTQKHAQLSADSQFDQGTRRIAAVYDLGNSAYTEDWLQQFRKAFEARGGKFVAAESFKSGVDVSYGTAISKLLGSEADMLHFVASATDTVRLLQLARANGFEQPVSAATWAATEQLIELGGRSVEGLRLTQYFDRDDSSPAYRAFHEAYVSRYKQEPGFASVAAYDAVRAIFAAIAKQKNRESLKSALLTAGPYEGIQGSWQFDPYGDAERDAWVTVVRSGRFARAN